MSNNGMMTRVWGPPGWLFLHSVTFGYPVKINQWDYKDNLKRMEYRNFFKNLGKILPCRYCRESYDKFYQEEPIDKFLDSRKSLTKWFYNIHNKVNNKLGVPKCDIPSFEEIEKQYESYRAKCKKTTPEERSKRLEKGCIIPKDGKPKKSYLKVLGCNNNNNYILINKYYIYLFILFTLFIIIFKINKK